MGRKMNYRLMPVKDVPENIFFDRVGIVPFFIENTTPKFFLMMDSKFNELTDCGGLPKSGEKWLDTALRETREESRGFFDFDKDQIIEEGFVFWREDNRIAIIFIDITAKVRNSVRAGALCHRYRTDYLLGIENRDKRERLENSDMNFLNKDTILEFCRNKGKIYIPVKMLFLKFFRHKYDFELLEKSKVF